MSRISSGSRLSRGRSRHRPGSAPVSEASYQDNQPKAGYRGENLYRGDDDGVRYSCSSTRGAERIQHASSPYQDDKALVLHSRLVSTRHYPSSSGTSSEAGRSSQMMATTPAYPSSQQHLQPDGDALATCSRLSGNPRSARSSVSHSSGSSISPSESASKISSRSSRYSSSSGSGSSGGRDDPQLLYEYVAKHLQYGEHEGVVWNRGTDSYVTVVRPC